MPTSPLTVSLNPNVEWDQLVVVTHEDADVIKTSFDELVIDLEHAEES